MSNRTKNALKGIAVFALVLGIGTMGLKLLYDATPEGKEVVAKQARLDADKPAIRVAETLVKVRLREPDSAAFTGVKVVHMDGSEAVCGFVNARNGLGGMTGDQWFAVIDADVFFMSDGPEASRKVTATCGIFG
ncbi:hypothetical protein N6H05_16810 [Sphingobium sp. WTD-1]|uniref:hypothetical protein n=1 Tax=Sphingobium sp. WTD-1 TaxID=2979467 RepID=UPI0024DE01F4|nr:hypothetical protein [Sphingobium sp. WTD-1]WIA54710.1 hypothetical protein N6H05_16810 [Sphingobium sp. WTD-1]